MFQCSVDWEWHYLEVWSCERKCSLVGGSGVTVGVDFVYSYVQPVSKVAHSLLLLPADKNVEICSFFLHAPGHENNVLNL